MRDEQDDAQYLRECVTVNQLDLNGEFVRVSADLAFCNARYAEAVEDLGRAKLRAEFNEARLYEEVRTAFLSEGTKPTEKMVESAIRQKEDYMASQEALIEAEGKKLRWYGLVDAVRTKRDSLISLGAQQRAEMSHDPVLRERARTERLVQNGRGDG